MNPQEIEIAKKSHRNIFFDSELLLKSILSKTIRDDFHQARKIKDFILDKLKERIVFKKKSFPEKEDLPISGYLGQAVPLDSPLVNQLLQNSTENLEHLISYKDLNYIFYSFGVLSNSESNQIYNAISESFLEQDHIVSTLDHKEILKKELESFTDKLTNKKSFQKSNEALAKYLWKDFSISLTKILKEVTEGAWANLVEKYFQRFEEILLKVNTILFINQSELLNKKPIELLARDEMESLPIEEFGPSVLYQKVLKKSYCLPISYLTVEQLRIFGIQAYLSYPLLDKSNQIYYMNRNEHINIEIPIAADFVIMVDPTFFSPDISYENVDTFISEIKSLYQMKSNFSKRLTFFPSLSLKIVDMTYATHEEEEKAADLALNIDPFSWKADFLKAYSIHSRPFPINLDDRLEWFLKVIENYKLSSLKQPMGLKSHENVFHLGYDFIRSVLNNKINSPAVDTFNRTWLSMNSEKSFFVALRKEMAKNKNSLDENELAEHIKKSDMVNLESLLDLYLSYWNKINEYYKSDILKVKVLKGKAQFILQEILYLYKDYPEFIRNKKTFLETMKRFRRHL